MNENDKQAEPVAWVVVFNAVKQAIELCKNATGQHSRISTYVNAVQITHDALGTDNTHPAQPVQPAGAEEFNAQSFLSLWSSYCDKKIEVENLEAVNEQLLEALVSFTKSEYIKREHPIRYKNALEAIAAAQQALAHVNETPKNEHDSDDVLKRAPLVRLTEHQLEQLGCSYAEDFDFANAIMDAMERVNK